MLVVLAAAAALGAQAPAPCPRAPFAAAQVSAGWQAYRRGAVADAAARFAAADSLCPGDHGAQVGLGFVLLRQERARAAAERFRHAIGSDARDGDAWYGSGLARARQGERAQAGQALRLAPGYVDAEQQILALGIDSGLALPPARRPDEPAVPARTLGDGFEIRSGDGWRPFYVKGINLGAALPGRFPSEPPADDSTYARWLELIAGASANVVRLYTILPPAFYRALKRWNDGHPDRALWLVHGVWTELPPRHDYDAAAWKEAFRAEMRRVVDLVHGRALIAARPGHAFGRYDADVSDHVLAYIIGREWEPFSIRAYNGRRRDRTAYAGRFLAVDRGTPADVWMAEQCDYLLAYEWDGYHSQRPIAYTNWPTLDPLTHPTEPTLDEEQALRRRYGFPPNLRLKEYDNDRESLDAMLVRPTPADLGGYFASYHAYPYYPDFIGLDSAYAPSHYLGYLRALKRHHAGRALLIAEYGVPSSRGTSHLEAEGMDHGGHDERAMAAIDARLTREVRQAGAAGGILFAWLDEWFKHTWVTVDLEVPADRTRLWHNVENAEQNYGLLGEYAGAADSTPEPGGAAAPWRALALLQARGVLTLRVGADPSYVYLALGGASLDSTRYVIGIDTYRPDRGSFGLPGVAEPGDVGFEFALALNDTSDTQLLVVPWYNPYLGPRRGVGPTALDRFYNEAATVDVARRGGPGGPGEMTYDSLFVTTNRWRIGRDGRTYPARGTNRGRLRYGRAQQSSLADWYVDRDAGLVEVRIAWALLNVTDPSSRRVMVRYRRDGAFETAVTDGFRFAVAALRRASGAVTARIPPPTPTPTFTWPTWEVPTWHERLKPAYAAMRDVWGSW